MPTEKEYLAKKQLLETKQDKLTAGTNITISPSNVISATGGGSDVTVIQKTSQGENIADIRVDGITTRLYAPGGGLRYFTETQNTLYGKQAFTTPHWTCDDPDYFFNVPFNEHIHAWWTPQDGLEVNKLNNIPCICMASMFTLPSGLGSGGIIFISTEIDGTEFQFWNHGEQEYMTVKYTTTPDYDSGSNLHVASGTITYDDITWYYCTMGTGGSSISSTDGIVQFNSSTEGALSLVVEAALDLADPQYFDGYYNGIARTSGLAFFAGGHDANGTDAPIKIYTDGTYEGIGGGSDVSITPTLATGTKIADYEIDGTTGSLYAPTGGGGTGNVDDVYVNGTSVLDSNHIAQIKSYKELTQAEYDALPSSKLTDDIMYCITDAGITEGDTFAPIIYSLEEREVGTWTDGRPLYQRTFSGSWNISDSWIDTGEDIPNGWAVKAEAVVYESDGNAIQVLSNISPNGDIYLYSLRSGITYVVNYFTIWYTKTTDTPGSAQYTPLGVPAVHYSIDEQIIGTWIDGNTVYQKTYVFDQSIAIPGNSYADITQEVPDYIDMDTIVTAFVTSNAKATDSVWCGMDNNRFCLYCAEGINADTLTIQYTKVTV